MGAGVLWTHRESAGLRFLDEDSHSARRERRLDNAPRGAVTSQRTAALGDSSTENARSCGNRWRRLVGDHIAPLAPGLHFCAPRVPTIERDELLRLLRRDHRELEMALMELASPDLQLPQRRTILDGVRLMIAAHGAAEDIVVYAAFARIPATQALQLLVEQARVAHDQLDAILARLLATPVASPAWFDLVHLLRLRAEAHASREENDLLPALCAAVPPDLYRSLAGAFATERLRQLAMLQPSAPIVLPADARV
jgi:hypothetical protein